MSRKLPSTITFERLRELMEEDDNTGICTECGEEQSCVEPDARGYTCECCGKPTVIGVAELLLSYL